MCAVCACKRACVWALCVCMELALACVCIPGAQMFVGRELWVGKGLGCLSCIVGVGAIIGECGRLLQLLQCC